MNNFWSDLPKPFFVLAPMEAVTDVVFRHVVAKAGAPDIWFSEFTNATGWVHAGQKAIGGRLIKTDDEQPIVAQIWGGEPGDMQQLAEHCRGLGFHGIDINMGCPAKSAIKSGGAALIRHPDLAVKAIAAAKTAGLPVSVKTRLGYTYVDEWRDWLRTLLQQDIVNLTIHLRTKKEMSKVPAHFELIPEIIALRDEIAPQTLLTINGDIRDRAHGEALAEEHPGIDGIMIGRGVFQDPFCFNVTRSSPSNHPSSQAGSSLTDTASALDEPMTESHIPRGGRLNGSSTVAEQTLESTQSSSRATKSSETSAARVTAAAYATGTRREAVSEDFGGENANRTKNQSAEAVLGGCGDEGVNNKKKQDLIDLLHYQLDLFDTWQPQLNRPYETLKRFYKIYIRDFDGAKETRDQLMHTKNTDEARALLRTISD